MTAPRHIAIVDDEADIRTIAELGLTMTTPWRVSTAASGREGITQAISDSPDAILLDVMMPEFDGLATIAELQSSNATKHIPIILLTAKAQASDRRQYYAVGVKGVITKPFDPTTLANQIAGFLGWDDFA
ncbi:MAG: response regulator [Cyanobacteria bacterium P01_D01_bin.123]